MLAVDRITKVLERTSGKPYDLVNMFLLLHDARYDPGAFHNGFKGLCSVFVTAAFSFAGTELVGLCAAETDNPRKTLPTAVKQVFWRICLVSIYISSSLANLCACG
jgi:amino acid permease